MGAQQRAIELEVDVVGTPDEVWRAVATGPGISSWYVPHVVEECAGGTATASFGDTPEMQVPGRVAVWEPPRRIVFDGGADAGGLAFEWTVTPRDAGSSTVHLTNRGFGEGTEWDDQYDAMVDGWKLFMFNLQLHCRHFAGETAVAMLPSVPSPIERAFAWENVCSELGIAADCAVGDHIEAHTNSGASIAGEVLRVGSTSLALLLDSPALGTAFIAAEGGNGCMISVWSYLYGADAEEIVERDRPRWVAWLESLSS